MDQDIIKIRHWLHQHPELSNQELNTGTRIARFMAGLGPNQIFDVSKTGKLFVFDSHKEGKTTVFRADMDALPIHESSQLDYKSAFQGVAHSCGHDGHMAVLLGLAKKIAKSRPHKGKVVLLFQPAEECEQGARDVVNSSVFEALETDAIFGLHNIPKAPKHQIIIRKGSFAAASKGMTLKLFGKPSHAAEPEKGVSPADAIAKLVVALHELRENKTLFSDLVLLTIIHIELGKIAFGTSPGYAEMRLTLRAYENHDMQKLTSQTEQIIKQITEQEDLKHEIGYSEIFPAVLNSDTCVEQIKKAAQEKGYDLIEKEQPFKWSEDFGYYTEKYKGGFFGLGSGLNQPALHHSDFDFPDDIIETGVNLFYQLYKQVHL